MNENKLYCDKIETINMCLCDVFFFQNKESGEKCFF